MIVRGDGSQAIFSGPNSVAMVRVRHNSRVRRLSAARVAHAIIKGPGAGRVARSARWDKTSDRPHAAGGRASSLTCRAETDMALIRAMASASQVSIAQLSTLSGSPESCVSARLGRLAERGLT